MKEIGRLGNRFGEMVEHMVIPNLVDKFHVKTKPTTEDVNDHVQRMEKARRYADLHGDPRKYRGAVAGMVVNEDVRDYILGKGFYAIEPSGDTFNIIEPTGKYRPREW
jgi:hypothetical protein